MALAKPGPKTLKATVGAAAAALLINYVPQFEGLVLKGYKDPIGIVTACSGHTKTAVFGRIYTKEECSKLLEQDLVQHAQGVIQCTPQLLGHPYQLAATTSFAYNVGVFKYCGSTMAKKFARGDLIGACNELPKWTKAGGIVFPGLVKRREIEKEICEEGLS